MDSLSNLKNLVLNTNLNENMIFIFEKKLNISKLIPKRNESKISENFFEINDNKKDNSINIFIGRNIFTQEEITIIKLKEEKITFKEMINRINNIKINETKKILFNLINV